MKRNIVFLILLPMLLSACGKSYATTAHDSVTPIITSTPAPTRTPFVSPTPIPTFELLITATNPAPTMQAAATLQALAAQYQFMYPVQPYNCNATGLSPNGEWAVIESGLRVVRLDGKVKWDLKSFFDTFGKQYRNQYSSIELVHWSKDGKYLYFLPCYPLEKIFPNRLLYTINLQTGKIVNTHFDFVSAFSPDDKYIVYKDGDLIRIDEIATGIEFYIDMSSYIFDDLGWFAWSPDGKQIAFTAVKYDYRGYSYLDQYSVYLINLADLSIRTLIKKHDPFQGYYTVSWTEPNLIRLRSRNGDNYGVFNLEDNRLYLLSFVTPTP